MKKSKRTIMTAALLSAAVTMQSQIKAPSTGNESEAAVLYGPPWVFYAKGDVNMDNKTNIVDLILLKSNGTGQKETSYWEELADLDGDAKISRTDIRMMERFLFGAASNVNEQLPNEDEDIVPQPEYGTPVIEPSYQTKYGCPPSLVTEPAVTEPETDPTF
ncbi:MAG: dockerin type I repeat-containing protein, partial [Oscillospiraceae bacterium]|nr:dockerin type I repeat-containing protein [Oscillospiraceae bacterium]